MEFTNNVNLNHLKTEVKTEVLVDVLQQMFDMYMDDQRRFGSESERTQMHFGWVIGAKELVEACIGQPVNLQRDGVVRIGF